MAPLDYLTTFRTREEGLGVEDAVWYVLATTALTSASAGEHVGDLYRQVTAGLSVEDRKTVQRRMKEALTKGSILYGIPRSASGLASLYSALPENEVDNYAPRTEKWNSTGDAARREERGRKYFDKIWGPVAAQGHRERSFKYCPDVELLNIRTNYALWMSEDAILSDVETQMCNTALLVCNNSPIQALWHLQGLLRHGGTLEQARFAQELGLATASEFGAKTGDITMVDDIKT